MITQDQITAVINAFSPLAKKISVGSNTIFEWALRTSIIDGVFDLIICGVLSYLIYLGIKFLKRIYKDDDYEGYACVIAALLPFLFAGAIFIGNKGIIEVFSPQYSAIKLLISTATGN